MMHCPFCQCPTRTRTSRYLSETVKQIYYQCTNILCSATFRTMESLDTIIRPPSENDLMEDEFISAHAGTLKKQSL